VNYTIDNFTIGIFLNTAAVGVYSVGLRLSEALFRMTHQLHVFLFPMVVERNVEGNVQSQRLLMIRATRFQLAVAIAVCGAVAAVGDVLIPAWVGNGFEGSVPVLQILAFVVVLRAWQAMPGTLLKGTGHHKFVAAGASGCALANVLLSIALVKPLGIVGVALGTAIPVLILSAVVIFPVACRAVGLSTWRGYREIVWPTVWPAVVVIALLAATRHALPVRIIAVLAHLALGGLVYAVLFFALGLDRDERRWFMVKVSELWRGRPALATA
jgi:O-antigen/teichoic acid export membrane protein